MAWRFDSNGMAFDDSLLPQKKKMGTNAPLDSAQIVLPSTPLPYNQDSETQKLAKGIADRPMRMYGTNGEMNVPKEDLPLPTILPKISPIYNQNNTFQGEPPLPSKMPVINPETPFAESMIVPQVRRPLNLPVPAPVVEGVTMKRGLPGSGDFGENLDMMPQNIRRQNPMGIDEARNSGILLPSKPSFRFRQIGRAPTGPTAGMGMTGDEERAAMDTATRGERWGSGGSTTRRMNRASDIIDQIRANRDMKTQSDIRAAEALKTPQLATGTYVGQAWVPDGKGGGSVQTVDATTGGGNRSPKPMTPAQAANILKQAAQMRKGDKMKMIQPDPDTADAMENMLRAQGYDVDALKGGAPAAEPATAKPSAVKQAAAPTSAATAAAPKPKYYEGQKGVLNGKNMVFKGGQWIPA